MEGSPLGGKSLGADGGSEIGFSNGRSYENGDGKIEGSPLGYALGSEVVTKLGNFDGIPGGKKSEYWIYLHW